MILHVQLIIVVSKIVLPLGSISTNRTCPKDNFPTPFIDQILDECVGSEVFSFMDGFYGYNQI